MLAHVRAWRERESEICRQERRRVEERCAIVDRDVGTRQMHVELCMKATVHWPLLAHGSLKQAALMAAY